MGDIEEFLGGHPAVVQGDLLEMVPGSCPGSCLDTRSTAFSTRGATFSTEFLDLERRRNWDCQTLLKILYSSVNLHWVVVWNVFWE